MQHQYAFDTRIGRFFIGFDGERYHPIFDNESLGSYYSARQAVDDLAGGHTFSLPNGAETDGLGIPDDLGEWMDLRR